jgi:hypothetical protein
VSAAVLEDALHLSVDRAHHDTARTAGDFRYGIRSEVVEDHLDRSDRCEDRRNHRLQPIAHRERLGVVDRRAVSVK